MVELTVNSNSYDKINKFVELLKSRGVLFKVKHKAGKGLILMVDDNDLDVVISLTKRNKFYIS